MPYIKPDDRKEFLSILENTVETILEPSVNDKYLLLYHFLGKLLSFYSYSPSPWIELPASQINEEKIIEENAEKLIKKLTAESYSTIIEHAGKLNFMMSFVIWKVLNQVNSGYGFRTLVKGMLWRLYEIFAAGPGTGSDSIQSFILRGVITDVIDEMYRRQTSVYEDAKIAENGDII